MARAIRDEPSYFELPPHGAGSISDGSEQVSPTNTSPTANPASDQGISANTGEHSSLPHEGLTNDQPYKARIEVPGIEESLSTISGISRIKIFDHQRLSKISGDAGYQRSSGTEESAKTPGSESTDKSARPPSAPIPRGRFRRRPSWTRTRSGGILYQKHRNSSSQGDSSSKSTSMFSRRSQSLKRNSSPILPLKPPDSHKKLENTATVHKVQVEESFDDTSRKTSGQIDVSHLPTPVKTNASSPRVSVTARKIFSRPFDAFRKVRPRHGSNESIMSAGMLPSSSSNQVQGHQTLLKHQQTSLVLNKVSSVLEIMGLNRSRSSGDTSKPSCDTSTSSEGLQCAIGSQKPLQTCALPFSIFKNQDLDAFHDQQSLSSSILVMQRGHTPKTTPYDEATYKVKRSPSADTEVFLKIDISTYGNTSYLQSEARRIHTPPMPECGANGRLWGKFFDYTVPDQMEKQPCETVIDMANGHTLKPVVKCGTHLLPRSAGQVLRSSVSGSMRRPTRSARSRTVDWYDLQLADLDEMELSDSPADEHLSCQDVCKARMLEDKRKRYEAQLDRSIPEHLPNSPLCPRHPRYWRVVENRGSQFRGCWMHGHGVNEDADSMVSIKGIAHQPK